MSMQQYNLILGMQDELARRFRSAGYGAFFQYDYAESQQEFTKKYPSADLKGMGGLKNWEWFIDENGTNSIYNLPLNLH